jgi:hypothetical protein
VRWQFRLAYPDAGMNGGGIGQCPLPRLNDHRFKFPEGSKATVSNGPAAATVGHPAMRKLIAVPPAVRDGGQYRRPQFGMYAPQIVALEGVVGWLLPQCGRRLATRTAARKNYRGPVVKA